jgi:hypothetical protein
MTTPQSTTREAIISAAYDGQQSSYRELELLYHNMTERALKAEAEASALKQQLANVQQEVETLVSLQEQVLRGLELQRDTAMVQTEQVIANFNALVALMERAASHLPGQPDLAERVLSLVLEGRKL